ncbi:MAG: hypothetical protein J6X28_02615 [Bacilli bacterium]|nr:hypothetical protein [Bacilli bacterium]
MIEKIEEMEKELLKTHEPEVKTAIRGRIILKIKEFLKNPEITEEEKNTLEEKQKNHLKEQRKHLDNRYVNEFLKDKAVVGSMFTTLPKGVKISVERIKNSIEELKQAKTNKEKIFNVLGLMRSITQTVLTPVVYGGKFLLRHWYAVLISLGILELTDTGIFKKIMEFFGKNEENSDFLKTLADVKKAPGVSQVRNLTQEFKNLIYDHFGGFIDDMKEKLGDSIDFHSDEFKEFVKDHQEVFDKIGTFLERNQSYNGLEEYGILQNVCAAGENILLQKAI